MAVSKELVTELRVILKEDYEREVDFQQASLIANDLVGYFDLLAKMHHQDNEYEDTLTTRRINTIAADLK